MDLKVLTHNLMIFWLFPQVFYRALLTPFRFLIPAEWRSFMRWTGEPIAANVT